jgi:hypothetical protein
MEKIINSAFDFFAYALPGAFLILSLLILDPGNDTCQDFINFAQKLQTGGSLMLLAVGYVLGFAITPLGRKLYRRFNRTRLFLWLDDAFEGNLKNKFYAFDQNNGGTPSMSVSERFVLVREFSPNNFRHIESWHVYSLMSHNMALVNILIFAFSGARLVFFENRFPGWWWAVMGSALLLTILFLYNAVKFNIWSANELNATVDGLQLKSRAESRSSSDTRPQS